MHLWQCTCGSALVAVYLWQCTCGSALVPLYLRQCTCGSVVVAVYWRQCTGGSVLAAVYLWQTVFHQLGSSLPACRMPVSDPMNPSDSPFTSPSLQQVHFPLPLYSRSIFLSLSTAGPFTSPSLQQVHFPVQCCHLRRLC